MSRKNIMAFIAVVFLAAGFLLVIFFVNNYRASAKVLDDPLPVFNNQQATPTFQDVPTDYVFNSRIAIYPKPGEEMMPVVAPSEAGDFSSAAKLKKENPALQGELLQIFDYSSFIKNNAPIFTSIDNQEIISGPTSEPLFFKVEAKDVENDSLKYHALFLPPGATFNSETQMFSWIPGYFQFGEYSVLFLVTDGQNITYASVNLEIEFSLF